MTNESLGTGGSYGNKVLDGTMLGVGYNYSTDTGAFIRVEGNYMDFDGATVTNGADATKTIKLKSLDGVTGKVSIGKGTWIASHSSVKCGTTIGSGSIIASNASVVCNVKENSIYGGVPAKLIKDNIESIATVSTKTDLFN